MPSLEISEPFVTLGQALKWSGIIQTGGQAREFLSMVRVLVNGERDERRGRKLYPGDTVEAPGEEVITIVAETLEPEPVPPPPTEPKAPTRRIVRQTPPARTGRPVARRRTP